MRALVADVALTAILGGALALTAGASSTATAAPPAAASAPAVVPAATGEPCLVVYSHTADQEISAGAADDHTTIVVPETATLADVDVRVNVLHPNDQEVELTLFHGAQVATLVSGAGGTGDNFEHTVLDDEAATALTAGTAPFAGRYRPIQPLSVFDGAAADGEWQMLAKDASTGPGTLDYWRIILTFESCDLDEDGVEDHDDQCLGLAGPAPSGCPVVAGDLTLRWGDGRWSGRLAAEAPGCVSGRTVQVFKVRDGDDRLVAKATTASDGSWRKASDRPSGRFYAKAPKVLVPGTGICSAVRSTTKSF